MFPQCFGYQGFRRTWEDTLSLGLDGILFSHKDLTASNTFEKVQKDTPSRRPS